MSPRTTSQCCRAVHRQITPPSDGPWISDALLINALERYWSVSRTSRRYGSNVPGPLESRRRLGKRQMGELNLGHLHPMAPLWSLEDPVDLTQWRWKAPSPLHRLKIKPIESQQGVNPGSFLDWILGRSSARHEVDSVLQSSTATVEAVLERNRPEYQIETMTVTDQASISLSPAEALPSSKTELSMFDNLMSEAQSILLLDAGGGVDRTIMTSLEFRAMLRARLDTGGISIDIIHALSKAIRNAILSKKITKSAGSNGEARMKAARFALNIYRDILRSRELRDSFQSAAWNILLLDMAVLADLGVKNVRLGHLELFRDILRTMSESQISETATGINATLYSYLARWQRKGREAIREVELLAAALAEIRPPETSRLLSTINKTLVQQSCWDPQIRRIWLRLIARVPSVGHSFLFQTWQILFDRRLMAPLTHGELSWLFITYMKSRDKFANSPSIQHMLETIVMTGDESWRTNEIAMKLWGNGQASYLRILYMFVCQLDSPVQGLKLVQGFMSQDPAPVTPLAELILKLDDPELVLDVYEGYWKYLRQTTHGKEFCLPPSIIEKLYTLTSTTNLNPYQLLTALLQTRTKTRLTLYYRVRTPVPQGLRLDQLRGKTGIDDLESGSKWQATVRYVPGHGLGSARTATPWSGTQPLYEAELAAEVVAHASNIKPARALRFVIHCINIAEQHHVPLSPRILDALRTTVMRHWTTHPIARTRRSRYFLSLLLKHGGEDATISTGLALRTWLEVVKGKHARERKVIGSRNGMARTPNATNSIPIRS